MLLAIGSDLFEWAASAVRHKGYSRLPTQSGIRDQTTLGIQLKWLQPRIALHQPKEIEQLLKECLGYPQHPHPSPLKPHPTFTWADDPPARSGFRTHVDHQL